MQKHAHDAPTESAEEDLGNGASTYVVPGDSWASLPCSFRRLVVRSALLGESSCGASGGNAPTNVSVERSERRGSISVNLPPIWVEPRKTTVGRQQAFTAPFVIAALRWVDLMEHLFVADAPGKPGSNSNAGAGAGDGDPRRGAEAAAVGDPARQAAARLEELRRRTSDGLVRVSPDTLGELYPDLGELVRDGATGLMSLPALAHLYASFTLTFAHACSCRWILPPPARSKNAARLSHATPVAATASTLGRSCGNYVVEQERLLQEALAAMAAAEAHGSPAALEKACSDVMVLDPLLPDPFRLRAKARLVGANRWWCMEDLRVYLMLSSRHGYAPRHHVDAYWCMAEACLKELEYRTEKQKGLLTDGDFIGFVDQADSALQLAFRYDGLDAGRAHGGVPETRLAQSAAARHLLQRIEAHRAARRTAAEMLDAPLLLDASRGGSAGAGGTTCAGDGEELESEVLSQNCAVPWPIDLCAGLPDVALFSRTPTIGSSVQHQVLHLLFLDARNVLDLLATMQSMAARSTAFAIRNAENLHWKHRPKPVHAYMQSPSPERLAHALVCMLIAKQIGTVLDGAAGGAAAGSRALDVQAAAIRGPAFTVEETTHDRFLVSLFCGVVFCRTLTAPQRAELDRLLTLLIFASMDMDWMRRAFPWLDIDDCRLRAKSAEQEQKNDAAGGEGAAGNEDAQQPGWWRQAIGSGRPWGTSLLLFQLQQIWLGWLSTSAASRSRQIPPRPRPPPPPSSRKPTEQPPSGRPAPLEASPAAPVAMAEPAPRRRLDMLGVHEAARRALLGTAALEAALVTAAAVAASPQTSLAPEGLSQRKLWALAGHLPVGNVALESAPDYSADGDDDPLSRFHPPNRRLRWRPLLEEVAALRPEQWRPNPCVLDPVSWSFDAGALTDPFQALSWRLRSACGGGGASSTPAAGAAAAAASPASLRTAAGGSDGRGADRALREPWLLPPHELLEPADPALPEAGGAEPLAVEVIWEHIMEQLKPLSTIFNTREATDAVRARAMPKPLSSYADDKEGQTASRAAAPVVLPRKAGLRTAIHVERARRAALKTDVDEGVVNKKEKELTQAGIDRELSILKVRQHQAGLDTELRDYVTLASVRKKEADSLNGHAHGSGHHSLMLEAVNASTAPTWHPAPATCAPVRFRFIVCAGSHWQVAKNASSQMRNFDVIDARGLLMTDAGILGLSTWFDMLLKPTPYAYIQTRQCEEIFLEKLRNKAATSNDASQDGGETGVGSSPTAFSPVAPSRGIPTPPRKPPPSRPWEAGLPVQKSVAPESISLTFSPAVCKAAAAHAGKRRAVLSKVGIMKWTTTEVPAPLFGPPRPKFTLPMRSNENQPRLGPSPRASLTFDMRLAAELAEQVEQNRQQEQQKQEADEQKAGEHVDQDINTDGSHEQAQDPGELIDAEETVAASRIQVAFRRRRRKREHRRALAATELETQQVAEAQAAATRIQKLFRGRRQRHISSRRHKSLDERATLIQAAFRGKMARRRIGFVRYPTQAKLGLGNAVEDQSEKAPAEQPPSAAVEPAEPAQQTLELEMPSIDSASSEGVVEEEDQGGGDASSSPGQAISEKTRTQLLKATVEKFKSAGTSKQNVKNAGVDLSVTSNMSAADVEFSHKRCLPAPPPLVSSMAGGGISVLKSKRRFSYVRPGKAVLVAGTLGADLPELPHAPPSTLGALGLHGSHGHGTHAPLGPHSPTLSPRLAGKAAAQNQQSDHAHGFHFVTDLATVAEAPASPRAGYSQGRRWKARTSQKHDTKAPTTTAEPKVLKTVSLHLQQDEPDASHGESATDATIERDRKRKHHGSVRLSHLSPAADAHASAASGPPSASPSDSQRRSQLSEPAAAPFEQATPLQTNSAISLDAEGLELAKQQLVATQPSSSALQARLVLAAPAPRPPTRHADSAEVVGVRPTVLPPYIAESKLFNQLVQESLSTAVSGPQMQQLLGIVARAEPIWAECGMSYYGAASMPVRRDVYPWDSSLESICIVARNWPCATERFTGTALGRTRNTSQQQWIREPPSARDLESDYLERHRLPPDDQAGAAVIGPRLLRLRRFGHHPCLVCAGMSPPANGNTRRFCANAAFCSKYAVDASDISATDDADELHCPDCECAWYCSANCQVMHRTAHMAECQSLIALREAGAGLDTQGTVKGIERNKRLLALTLEQMLSKQLDMGASSSRGACLSQFAEPSCETQPQLRKQSICSSLLKPAVGAASARRMSAAFLDLGTTGKLSAMSAPEAATAEDEWIGADVGTGVSRKSRIFQIQNRFGHTAASVVRLLARWAQASAPVLREVVEDGLVFSVITGRCQSRDSQDKCFDRDGVVAMCSHRMGLHIAASQQWRLLAPTLVPPKRFRKDGLQGIDCAQYCAYYAFFQPLRMPFSEQPSLKPVACIVWGDSARDAVLAMPYSPSFHSSERMRTGVEPMRTFMEIASEHLAHVQLIDGVQLDMLTGKAVFLLYSNVAEAVSSVGGIAWVLLLDAACGLKAIASPMPARELRRCAL